MQAAFFVQPGPPEVIQFGDLPEPTCGENQVKIRVGAVSVNPIDTYIRKGANYWPLPNPFIIGSDFAGTVIEAGKGVRNLEVGQRVWGSNQGLKGRQGSFAEVICVDREWVYPTPDNATDETMAAIALVGITAHLGLFRHAKLTPNDTLFVRGGTGGVSSMVLQMAKAIGATVVTTAGSQAKAERCRELGADHVIEYRSTDVPQALAKFAPDGIDVFWETLREPDFDFAVNSLRLAGRMVLMAGRDARPFYVKGLSLHGFAMFNAPPTEQSVAAADINRWIQSGALKAQIDRTLPLEQAAEAHRLQEANTVDKQSNLSGKIVLTLKPA